MSTIGATPSSTTAEELLRLIKDLKREDLVRLADLIREENDESGNLGILAAGGSAGMCFLATLVVLAGIILGDDDVRRSGSKAVGRNCGS